MEARTRGDIRISGAGTVRGGFFGKVSISGSGKVEGDVEAEEISVSGSGRFQGNVKAGALRASGSLAVEGNVEAEEFRCSGSGRASGDVTAESFRASGSMKVEGKGKADEMVISGSGQFGRDVEAQRFRSSGAFRVGGKLQAERMEIALAGESHAEEISGGTITVIQSGQGILLGLFAVGKAGVLETRRIEGGDIYLESTRAERVEGRRVKIGPGCRIQNVQYSEALEVDPKAEVSEYGYTGTGAPPAVERQKVERPDGWARQRGGWRLATGAGAEIRSPVLRALGASFGLLIAAVVVAIVLFAVLPAVSLVVTVALGAVAVLLLVLAVGIPVAVIGAAVVRLAQGLSGGARPTSNDDQK